MRLIEMPGALVTGDERWSLGTNRVSRTCGVWIRSTDPCADTSADVVGDSTTRASTYFVKPSAVEAILTRSVVCEQPDDESWLRQALLDYDDFIASKALVVQPITGTDSYTGHADVLSVTLTSTSDATLADSVAAGRKYWFGHVAGAGTQPWMHVPPSLAPALVRGGVLLAGTGRSVWGEPVIISEGYDLAANPRVFFSAPVKVFMNDPMTVGIHRIPRTNDSQWAFNQEYMVDVPPCSIVRVGTY